MMKNEKHKKRKIWIITQTVINGMIVELLFEVEKDGIIVGVGVIELM